MSLQSLHTGATGMIAQSQNLEVIANNLANVSTDGFKKSRANFEDLLYKLVKIPGAGVEGDDRTPAQGLQFGVGSRVSSTQLNFQAGTVRPTGKPLDLAIQGTGFFEVDDGQGNSLFTRAGNFTLNSQGTLVLATATRGLVIQPQVTIPPDTISIGISPDGQLAITQAGNPTPQVVGQLNAVRFQNPEGLQQIGDNLFTQTGSSGAPEQGQFNQDGFGVVEQGFLESSNVEPVEELIAMITSQRAFEMNSQVIQTSAENLRTVTALRQ